MKKLTEDKFGGATLLDGECILVWPPRMPSPPYTPSTTGSSSLYWPQWYCRTHGTSLGGEREDLPTPAMCAQAQEERRIEKEEHERAVKRARLLRVRAWRWASWYLPNLWNAVRGRPNDNDGY